MYKKGERIFSEEEARKIIEETVSYMVPEGRLAIKLTSWLGSGQSWARNRASLTSNQREITLYVHRQFGYDSRWNPTIQAISNQTDSESLKGIAQYVDFYYTHWKEKIPPDIVVSKPYSDAKGAEVWADKTFDRSVVENATAIEELTRLSEADNLMSSGYVETSGCKALHYSRDEWGRTEWLWGEVTQAQCSVTVRHPSGSGSSWAGKTSFDIDRVNIREIASLALDRCKKSLNPVRIEPGRYQVVLEPSATATLANLLMSALNRLDPERRGGGPVFLGKDELVNRLRSKLDLKLIDERINIFHEPTDPIVGSHFTPLHKRVDYIKNGILTGLADSYLEHLNEVSDDHPVYSTSSFTLSGGGVPIDEMISSSKRALLVARLESPLALDRESLLFSGFTRDGLWLIENGVITKAVRNFRWTESPLFALNNIEQIGIEEQVFSPVNSRAPLGHIFSNSLSNVVVPPLKVNDFSFTSTIDAV